MATDVTGTAGGRGETGAPPARAGASALRGALGFLVGFAPWILYWILTGSVSFRVAISVALGFSVAVNLISLARHERPPVLEIGTTVAFAALAVVGFVTDDVFVSRWIQPLGNAALLAIMVVSIAIGRPFTLDYAKASTPPELWDTPGFRYVNERICWVWIATMAFMTALALIPPIVQGDATMDDGGSPLSVVCFWVLPYVAMAGAIVFTTKFPDWFGAEFDDPPAPTNTAPATLAAAPDHERSGAVALQVDPDPSWLDEPVAVSVSGLAAGDPVTVALSTVDVLGNLWESTTTYAARADGTVDTASSAPTEGGYEGVDPTGPLWSMAFATTGRPADLYVPAPTANAVAVAVTTPTATLTRTVVRRGLPDGGSVTEVRGDGFVGRLVTPAGPGPFPAVALFGGSEGGIDSQWSNASVLAARGWASLSVGYFGLDGLPDGLVAVPLEALAAGIRALAADPRVRPGGVAAMAISRGAEGLLSTVARVPGLPVRAVVAVSPASVTWAAIGDDGTLPGTPSWTLAGEPVPFVEMSDATLMREAGRAALHDRGHAHEPRALHLAPAYAAVLGSPAAAAAAIPVEEIAVPVLAVTGDDDAVWPSGAMADAVLARRAGTAAATGDAHLRYPDAGHLIRLGVLATTVASSSGVAFGGTAAGTARAQRDATAAVLAFLDRTVGAGTPSPVAGPGSDPS